MTNRDKYFKGMCAYDFLMRLNSNLKDDCILGLILENEYNKTIYHNCMESYAIGCDISCSECINSWLNEEAKN